jgi:hypothetical protein
MDLAEAVEFDFTAAVSDIRRVRPGMEIRTMSSKRGAGMDEWRQFLDCRETPLPDPRYSKWTFGSTDMPGRSTFNPS